jgi:hypothetical protein
MAACGTLATSNAGEREAPAALTAAVVPIDSAQTANAQMMLRRKPRGPFKTECILVLMVVEMSEGERQQDRREIDDFSQPTNWSSPLYEW